MITDNQTNFVYIADTLSKKYPEFAQAFEAKLVEHGIHYGFLPGTKDVWAADYMPIQVSDNKFVRFTYKPDYLTSTLKYTKTISDVDAICERIGIQTVKSDIVLDGGNLSRWDDKALLTNKMFFENKHIPELELIQRLQDLLEINKIYFVPVEKGDWLGHIDAMARFISADTLLINDLSQENYKNYIDFISALNNANLKWVTFPFNPYDNKELDDASGIYLNYLELDNFIILPVFGFESDIFAILKAMELFKNKTIITVKSNQPAKDNGIINCLTWNIKKCNS